MSAEPHDFVHPSLNEEVLAIGGHYVLTAETRLAHRQREILYLTGYAVVDRSCCGLAGCGYALVPGYVLDWKYRRDASGRGVSRVEAVPDRGEERAELSRLIREKEMVTQVLFD